MIALLLKISAGHGPPSYLGFGFDLRGFSRTCRQNLIDNGVFLNDVQLAMGQSNPNITFKNYCGKRPEKAVSDIQDLLYQRQGGL
jgi:hypothetical protein